MKHWTVKMVLAALEATARRKSDEHGHTLGPWTDAKKKMGTGARKAQCVQCGGIVILTPHGYYPADNRAARHQPGMHGAVVFETCTIRGASQGRLM